MPTRRRSSGPPVSLNGVAGLTPTAGGGFAAAVGDIKALTGALITGTAGNVRTPVWIMNPQQAEQPRPDRNAGNGRVSRSVQEIAAGNLGGWPVIDSGTVPLGTVIAMDAADFVSVGGEGPRFEISDQATLHLRGHHASRHRHTGNTGCRRRAGQVDVPDRLVWRCGSSCRSTGRSVVAGTVAWVAGVTW